MDQQSEQSSPSEAETNSARPVSIDDGVAGTATGASGTEEVELSAAGPSVIRAGVIAGGLAVVTALLFWTSVHNGFLSVDDNVAVYANPHLTDPLYFWENSYFNLYTPVTYDIYSLVALVARMGHPIAMPDGGTYNLSPAVYHATNVLFHAINVALAFWLLRVLLMRPGVVPPGPLWRVEAGAAAGALLFGFDPLQAEAVSWVNGANNLFCGLFSLLALLLYIHAAMVFPVDPTVDGARSRRAESMRSRRLLAATACFVLALLAKPTAVALPLVAWALDVFVLRRARRESILLLWLVIALIFVMITISIQTREIPQISLWQRLFVASDAYAFYLEKLVWPWPLGFDYGRNPNFVFHHTAWYLSWCLPAALATLLWAYRRRLPMFAVAGAIFAVSLLPTVGLVSGYFNAASVVADRYVYLAMLGPALAVAWLLACRPHRAAFGVAAVLIGLCGAATHRQVSFWRSTYTIMAHSVAVCPNGWFAQTNLASYLDRSGDPARALPHSEAVVRLDPDNPLGHAELGTVLAELRRHEESAAEFERTAALDPPTQHGDSVTAPDLYVNARIDAAIQLKALDRSDEARDQLNDALVYAPGYPPAVAVQAELDSTSKNAAPGAAHP
ncbi:MAG: hypothetical protein ACLQVD_21375 [Capsulimonadaceae bacterium]